MANRSLALSNFFTGVTNWLAKIKNTDDNALYLLSDVTTSGTAKRTLRVAQENKVAGGKAYSALFSTEDKTNGAAYSHIVGVESGVWQPNAFPAGGSDLFGSVVGIKATAGTWPGVGHRVEFTDYTNFPGQFAVAYATLDGVAPIGFEMGVLHQTNDANSQALRFYSRNGGVRAYAGAVLGGQFGDLFVQAQNLIRLGPNGVVCDTYLGVGGTAGPRIVPVTGSPEGVLTGRVGSLALRLDGGAGTTFYVKESGAGNTGWVAK